jgi:hypothetical protein
MQARAGGTCIEYYTDVPFGEVAERWYASPHPRWGEQYPRKVRSLLDTWILAGRITVERRAGAAPQPIADVPIGALIPDHNNQALEHVRTARSYRTYTDAHGLVTGVGTAASAGSCSNRPHPGADGRRHQPRLAGSPAWVCRAELDLLRCRIWHEERPRTVLAQHRMDRVWRHRPRCVSFDHVAVLDVGHREPLVLVVTHRDLVRCDDTTSNEPHQGAAESAGEQRRGRDGAPERKQHDRNSRDHASQPAEHELDPYLPLPFGICRVLHEIPARCELPAAQMLLVETTPQ